jgi:hypothetical protein
LRLGAVPVERVGPPLRAVALLTQVHGDLEPGASDALGRRRHRTAARRLAATAVNAAAEVHGTFGDRPEPHQARPRLLADLPARAERPGPACAKALGEVARLALALTLPRISEDDDWQLGALAFADERALRELYDSCLTLAAMAVREAAAA